MPHLNPPGDSGVGFKKGDFFRPNLKTGEGDHRHRDYIKRLSSRKWRELLGRYIFGLQETN